MISMIRIVAIITFAALALIPLGAYAHGGTEVSVKGDVRANGPIEIVGVDFAANDAIRIELRRESAEPIELGHVTADETGSFTQTLHVPASIMAGLYQLAADGEESATAEVTVLESADGTGAATPSTAARGSVKNNRPSGETAGLGIFTAVVALVAVGLLLWVSRTHARSAGAGRKGGLT